MWYRPCESGDSRKPSSPVRWLAPSPDSAGCRTGDSRTRCGNAIAAVETDHFTNAKTLPMVCTPSARSARTRQPWSRERITQRQSPRTGPEPKQSNPGITESGTPGTGRNDSTRPRNTAKHTETEQRHTTRRSQGTSREPGLSSLRRSRVVTSPSPRSAAWPMKPVSGKFTPIIRTTPGLLTSCGCALLIISVCIPLGSNMRLPPIPKRAQLRRWRTPINPRQAVRAANPTSPSDPPAAILLQLHH